MVRKEEGTHEETIDSLWIGTDGNIELGRCEFCGWETGWVAQSA
jgi:hypothetical protein